MAADFALRDGYTCRSGMLNSALFKSKWKTPWAGGRTVGLIGSDLAGHPELETILSTIVESGGFFSLSSIRPEGLTPKVIDLLARTGQKNRHLGTGGGFSQAEEGNRKGDSLGTLLRTCGKARCCGNPEC